MRHLKSLSSILVLSLISPLGVALAVDAALGLTWNFDKLQPIAPLNINTSKLEHPGTVLVRLLVTNGQVSRCEILAGVPPLADAVQKSSRTWRFPRSASPVTVRGSIFITGSAGNSRTPQLPVVPPPPTGGKIEGVEFVGFSDAETAAIKKVFRVRPGQVLTQEVWDSGARAVKQFGKPARFEVAIGASGDPVLRFRRLQ